jgi:predicted adenine nucleotide alpha hydrolase (AANH) superfamily ATPase
MLRVAVLDAAGQHLSPCSLEKAQRMLAEGKATVVSENPLAIQLSYKVSPFVGRGAVSLKPQPELAPPVKPGAGKRLLLHICCGPCSTYTIKRLREQGFNVTGFWYNPNIHPFAEHERRRECIEDYARAVGLEMIEWEEYEMPAYFRAVAGHETLGERCALCYRLRLERTAQVAQQNGFNAFSTTLLISPYQQQALIHSIGDELASQLGTPSRVLGGGGLEFYFENLRRGWSERGHMAREHHLYQQQYCGCIYSEWEAAERSAAQAGQVAL